MKSNKKIIILIAVLIIVLIVLIIASNIINKENENVIVEEIIDQEGNKVEIGSSSFDSLQDAVSYYNMTLKKLAQSEKEGFTSDVYLIFHKELKLENKSVFESYIKAMAVQLQYNSFRMIDEANEITIEVYCDSKDRKIEKIIINGEENYFNKLKTNKQIENYEKIQITEVTVEAEELKHFIESNWKISKEELQTNSEVKTVIENGVEVEIAEGTEDTEEYVTYKDNVEVKVVDNKVFNLVFNNKYEATVIDGLKTTSTEEEIEKTLGKPVFQDLNIYGYKTEKFYIFFTDGQISIYRIDLVDDKVLQNAIEKLSQDKNIINFAKNILASWKDYDEIYNEGEKLELSYTLKGLKIQNTNALIPSIIIYSNYEGIVKDNKTLENMQNVNLPEEIQLDLETDLIFEYEKGRYNKIIMLNEYSN